uniref:G-patch domain-containing protein n=1 Tax=Meloidogyne incognita TaxID=6306 RepID=A0A914KN32_MELIC
MIIMRMDLHYFLVIMDSQNMDEEEISEKFDFDQTDFEFATGTRRFKRQTEEERIYGIWARDEDSDDDARPSFSSGKKRKEGPVRFVSVGVEKTSKESTVTETDEITIEARPEKRSKPSSFDQRTTNSVGSEVFAGFRNAAFQFASASGADAGWLKSGKGNVVMQMMQKMGYEQGKGLGKSKQGIVEPVQAVQRPGRGAVGAYGSEAKGPRFGESAAEAQNRINQSGSLNNLSEAETAQFPARGTWRKSNAGKVRIQYKTLNDVISEGESQRFGENGFGAVNAVGKIIDMTGPEQRIYEDFNSFSRRARMPIIADVERTNFNVPELTHNLNTLLDVTEEEICKTDRQVRYLKDQNEVLLNEQSRIEDELTESKAEIVRLEEVYTIVKQFYQESSLENSTLEECRELFITLREKYSVEYTLYGLDAIAIPVLLPKISKYFATWDPLDPEHASYGFEMMEDWKEILGSTKGGSLFKHFDKDSNASISAYDHCIWSGWMPSMRRAALTWNPRDNGPVMVSLVQKWMPILPNWVLENLLEQVLAPRIKIKVDDWDPVTDPVPIETWLHPWHAIMGDRLLHTYATLRQKLAKGLNSWLPGDRSAIESIRPWKEIFSASTLYTFISMNILPKLSRFLQNIDLSNTEQFEYIELFDWLEMVNVDVIAQILTKNFFPRYSQHVSYQVTNPAITMAELERIKKGYMDWKNLLPTDIQKHALVMSELRQILQLLAQCQNRLTGQNIPGIHQKSKPQPLSSIGPLGLPPPSPQFTSNLPPASFKQLVESSAISNGIQFFPQRSKFHDGKQVYMFGDFSVYMDGTVLFYYSPPRRQWLPASLNVLLEMCRKQ